jgi:thiamine-monophosphate kinase
VLNLDALPRSPWLAAQDLAVQRRCTLAGGDDYELVFTAPPRRRQQVQTAAQACGVAVTRVGSIDPEPGLRLLDANGLAFDAGLQSFDHFKTP